VDKHQLDALCDLEEYLQQLHNRLVSIVAGLQADPE